MALSDSHTFSLLSQLLVCSSSFDTGRLLVELDGCHVEVFRALLLGPQASVDGALTNVMATSSPSTPTAASPLSPSSSSSISPCSSPLSTSWSRASSDSDSGRSTRPAASLAPPLYVLQLCTPSLLHSRPAVWEAASLSILSRLDEELSECQRRCPDVAAVKLHRLCAQSLRQWRQQRPFLSRPMEMEALHRLTAFLSPIHRDILDAVRQQPLLPSSPSADTAQDVPLLPPSSPVHRRDEPHHSQLGYDKAMVANGELHALSGQADTDYSSSIDVPFSLSYISTGPHSFNFSSPAFLLSPSLSTSSSSSSAHSQLSPDSSMEGVDHFDLDSCDAANDDDSFAMQHSMWPLLSPPATRGRTLSSPPSSSSLSSLSSSSTATSSSLMSSPAPDHSTEWSRPVSKAVSPALAACFHSASSCSCCAPSRRRRRSTDLSAAFSSFSASMCASPPPIKRVRSYAAPYAEYSLSSTGEGGLYSHHNEAGDDCD